MQTILVTGGAGFIGSSLCERLLDLDYQILCVDNFSDYYSPDIKRNNICGCLQNRRFKLMEVDIRELPALIRVAEHTKIDGVVHLAARPGVIPSVNDPQETFENNVIGTQNVLELCRRMHIPKIVIASSSSVYGDRTDTPFREEDKTATPKSPYAASKAMSEVLAYAYSSAYQIDCVILRFFTVYGPRQRPDMAIHTFVKKVLSGNTLEVYGRPDSARDYTYIDDIIDGIVSAIEYQTRYDIFNLGNSSPIRLDHLVDIIISTTSRKIEVKWLPTRTGDVQVTYADISKARQLLGYSPKIAIEEGVTRFVEWYRNHNESKSVP